MDAAGRTPSATMKAARLTGPGRIEVIDVAIPAPADREVRVRLQGCGVCASNLGPWQGPEWMKFPTAPGGLGHEGWGMIDAVGDAVTAFAPGDRVAVLSQNAYAEYDVAPEECVVTLPPGLEGRAFPGEPLGCAMNIFRRSNVKAGDCVAIIGAGFLGLLLIQLCKMAGARVIALSRRPFALALARQAGADEVIALADHFAIIEQVHQLTGGRFCNVTIEAVGKQWPLDLAADLTGERGRLVIAGYHQDGLRQVNMQLWNWRGLDVINAHERDAAIYIGGMREAVAACEAGRLQPFDYLTHRYPLERLDEALDATRDRPEGFLKAVVMFS
ncbi:zinc-binding dehydrogenase [Allorhizobium sp. BGMRC 0089]|uniref:MDR/zinc-dependent alcohol dehydrogenase-like family protein n=1 Tax=Allorhizobium sonneratiae TaxID=2934936 RepID=UPI0020346701|nr:zinc-binding dehydrogenase [Allorhizobium sonneratiae]MCM2293991.1 zinc-binding dehydrogenase [Allorhizobium sonneratiae]